MKSPLFELQQSIFSRLDGAISCPVYDAVPDGADFPYVTIGEDTAVDWSTKIEGGQEVTTTVHVWSRYNGMAEAKQVMDEVTQHITSYSLAMDGFKSTISNLEMNEVFIDEDGTTRHGVVRFRFKIEEV